MLLYSAIHLPKKELCAQHLFGWKSGWRYSCANISTVNTELCFTSEHIAHSKSIIRFASLFSLSSQDCFWRLHAIGFRNAPNDTITAINCLKNCISPHITLRYSQSINLYSVSCHIFLIRNFHFKKKENNQFFPVFKKSLINLVTFGNHFGNYI